MFLPVVHRELSVAARQRMTYLSRTLSAGILLPILTLLYNLHSGGPGIGGPHILSILSTIVFVECMLAGMRYTSDCISEERREGTLGLLFLTDLSGLDIVLGKIVARGLRAFFSLLAALPILALTVLIGGVTGKQITAISITLVICILFSLAAGAFISSRGYRERNVLIGTLAFLIIITLVPVFLNFVAIQIFGFYGFVDTLLLVSPYHAFTEAGRGFTRALSPALWTLLAVSVVFIIYAAWRIRRTFGETEAPTPSTPLRSAPATSPWRAATNRPPVRRFPRFAFDPFAWLARRGRIGQSRIFAFAAFAFCFGIFCRTAIDANWNWAPPIIMLGSFGLHSIYKFLLTAETCRQINDDRRSGSLELILVTPADPNRLLRSQLTATWRAWFPVTVALAFMNFIWMTATPVSRDRVFEAMLPVSVILLGADTIVLPYRALLRAAYGERYTFTVFKTFIRTQGPPILVIALLLANAIGSNRQEAAAQAFWFWLFLCLGYSAVLIKDARSRLHQFRLLAAGEELPPLWKRYLPPSLAMRLPAPATAKPL